MVIPPSAPLRVAVAEADRIAGELGPGPAGVDGEGGAAEGGGRGADDCEAAARSHESHASVALKTCVFAVS
jgi:hypothetical protein